MKTPRIFSLAFLISLLAGCGTIFPDTAVPEVSGASYYIDCMEGDDSAPGTSASKAWGSLTPVNQTDFQPGDGIFFKRGTNCTGALSPAGSGAAGQPILIGAYGSGPLPIIDAGNQYPAAVKLEGQEYWELQDLEIIGGTTYGVLVSGTEGIEHLTHIRLTNLRVHDVWGEPFTDKITGLVVIRSNSSIFKDVIIDGVTAYNTDQWGGIEVNGAPWPIDFENPVLSENITIRNSTVYNVYGDGIVLWGVKHGLIEYSVAYQTGQQPSPQTVGTPSSIWTWSCVDCTVQFNESYLASTPEIDGGCYDIDWGTKNNLYQYNYGHDCDGYCISVFGAGFTTTKNAVARYNICANNGRRSSLASRQGDFYLSTWGGGDLDGVLIHNNTSFWSPDGNHPFFVNNADFTGERRNIFANNIVISTTPWFFDGGDNFSFDHNLYWLEGEGDPFFYFDSAYYTGFDEYQSSSGHDANSIFADPLLNVYTYHEVGRPAEAFHLQSGSPAVDAALDLRDMGDQDFFGNPVPYGGAFDIGAHEWSPDGQGTSRESKPGAVGMVDGWLRSISKSGLVLIGLVNAQDTTSHSQVIFLRSMAQQYAEVGLQTVLVEVSGLSGSELNNLAHNWHLDDIPLVSFSDLDLMDGSTPSVLLFNNGSLISTWDRIALPAELAMSLQANFIKK